MDTNSHRQIVHARINQAIETLIPNGGAATISETRLRYVFNQIGQVAFAEGENAALSNLLDIQQALNEINNRIQPRCISKRRLQAIAKDRHERFGIGYQMPGSGQWLFRQSEIESLIPALTSGRPRKDQS